MSVHQYHMFCPVIIKDTNVDYVDHHRSWQRPSLKEAETSMSGHKCRQQHCGKISRSCCFAKMEVATVGAIGCVRQAKILPITEWGGKVGFTVRSKMACEILRALWFILYDSNSNQDDLMWFYMFRIWSKSKKIFFVSLKTWLASCYMAVQSGTTWDVSNPSNQRIINQPCLPMYS